MILLEVPWWPDILYTPDTLNLQFTEGSSVLHYFTGQNRDAGTCRIPSPHELAITVAKQTPKYNYQYMSRNDFATSAFQTKRSCGLVVRVPNYRVGGWEPESRPPYKKDLKLYVWQFGDSGCVCYFIIFCKKNYP